MENKERWIDGFLDRKVKIAGCEMPMISLIFLEIMAFLAFFMRMKLFDIQSADYIGFLQPWMDEIRRLGNIKSLAYPISNYPVSYMYIMTLLSYIGGNDLYFLKFVSVLFDYLAAYAMFLVIITQTKNASKAVFSSVMVLMAPMILFDGAYWCQCDIIYTSFILFAYYKLLKKDSLGVGIFLGLAFCFKLQTVLILPFFVIMWLKKKDFNILHFLCIPIVYVISIIPAWIIGRDIKSLLTIYIDQAGYYPWGTLNYPNIYCLIDENAPKAHYPEQLSGAGMIFAIMLLGVIAYYVYLKKVELDYNMMVSIAILTVGMAVYFMPHMHDRYGFLLDVLAIIYVMLRPKKLPVFLGFSFVSISCSMPYLIVVEVVPFIWQATILGGLLVYIGMDLYKQLNKEAQ